MKIKNTRIYKVYRNIMRVDEVSRKVSEIEDNLQMCKINYNDKLDNLIEQNKRLLLELESIKRIARENQYANIYHDSIKNTKYDSIPLSLSSAAIGYPFAYILFKILDEVKPKNILEAGLGQSSKIISEYKKNNKNVNYNIVEHSKEWVDFFKLNSNISEQINFHLLENYKRKYKGYEVNAYKGFKEEFKNKKFDFISIDGPVGYGQEYSRMDILDIIPECLEDKFIIIIDDSERIGEQRTIELLEDKLKKHNVTFYSSFNYWGVNTVYICTSKDYEFLCHL